MYVNNYYIIDFTLKPTHRTGSAHSADFYHLKPVYHNAKTYKQDKIRGKCLLLSLLPLQKSNLRRHYGSTCTSIIRGGKSVNRKGGAYILVLDIPIPSFHARNRYQISAPRRLWAWLILCACAVVPGQLFERVSFFLFFSFFLFLSLSLFTNGGGL